MHTFHILSSLLIAASLSQASSVLTRSELNGPCTGASGAPGVCISTSDCTDGGGTYVSNKCPGTPDNIRCCTKTACGTSNKGNCRFTSSCSSGITETNKCPGPADFKCCMPAGSGYPPPTIPSPSSGCKKVAIDGAKDIVAAFSGKFLSIGCIRKCDSGDTSDHCDGMAVDMMVSNGVKVTTGEPIAEWVMNHRSSLSLKYVMWGQKIWNVDIDSVKPWSQWRHQDPYDRGSVTANHWDHVHVSFK